MDERNKITILKSAEPEELLVVHAESTKDQIRFYLNDKQFVFATDNDKGEIFVDIGQEVEVKDAKKEESKLTWIKENIVKILLFSIIITVLSAATTIFWGYISYLLGNAFFGLLFIYIMRYLFV